VNRATSPNPAHRPQSAWAALKLLTGRKAPSSGMPAGSKTTLDAILPARFSESALRLINGLAAGYLGFVLTSSLLGRNGAEALGVAAGFGVAGYMLPRLAALGVIVALAVALVRNGVGLGFAVLVPAIGGVWTVGVGSANGDVGRTPLGPVLVVPLALVGLGAGLPLLFGALMRPLGAALSAAVGALVLVGYDLTLDDGRVPYTGVQFDVIPASLNISDLAAWCGRILDYIQQYHPAFPLLFVLWAAMALAVSLGELTGRWLVGLIVAVGGGVLGYALVVSERSQALTDAVISLGLAAIMYAVLRYVIARVRG
jgi:eukaryotic-like serine/threonine-protein kinase